MAPNWWSTRLQTSVGSGCLSARRWSFSSSFATGFPERAKSVSGPKFILPAIDGSTVKQKLFLVALLVLAVAWPFMVSRGTVDIATLTMIYIILGLGLNVVVGLSGLLVLGYGGFYAIGAYTLRCSITITARASGPVCRLPG